MQHFPRWVIYGELEMPKRKGDSDEPVIDTGAAPEVFADALLECRVYGQNCHFTFYVPREKNGRKWKEVVLKLWLPTENVPPGIKIATKAIGRDVVVPAVTETARRLGLLN